MVMFVSKNPDPPILVFLISLLFVVFRFSLVFCVGFFLLSFPRILGVPRREKPLAFFGASLVFFFLKKSKVWRVREACGGGLSTIAADEAACSRTSEEAIATAPVCKHSHSAIAQDQGTEAT